ncbi:MAG: HAMP domain-containing histidine kinase [Actinobacteria bacterium]|nr:HAMP domain-containing histidine kinase [Actinomycetota bacterium]
MDRAGRPVRLGRARAAWAAIPLRRRLVAVQVILLLLGFGLVTVVTEVALHRFLLQRLDQQLTASSERFRLNLAEPDDHDADDQDFSVVAGQSAGTLGAQLRGGSIVHIEVVASRRDHAAPSARDLAAISALRPTSHPRTVRLPDLGEYRIAAVSSDGDLLVTGLPEDTVEDTIAHLLIIEGVVFAAAVLLIGAATAVSTRLALRPLTRVVSTATRVSELPLSTGDVDLSERVVDAPPGTEVGQVAEAFNQMLDHVGAALAERQASEERLRRFIADASHELRTPVAVVRSHAEYAQRVDGQPDPRVESALQRIAAESERMGHLVEDLLTLARLDSGRPLARDEVDLTRVVLDAVSDAQVAGPLHRWELVLPDEPVALTGDEHALHQVVANLLGNARDHTPAGTSVVCTVRAPNAEGEIVLLVADNGPGIPPDIRTTLFERFVHGRDDRSAAGSSTGLGLSIVSAIVAAHGGQLRVTSRSGSTEFEVRLRVRADAHVGSPARRAEASRSIASSISRSRVKR